MKPGRGIHDMVRKAYSRVAKRRASRCGPKKSSCCGKSAYAEPDHPVPEAELGLSCGNPIAFSMLREGDVVLDLGCGAGKDVFLAAQKVGKTGRSIGVDMTPGMLALARKNTARFRERTGLSNVGFRKGLIEKIPARDGEADAVISNCVINLSPDKPAVFREIFRVLKPGGRMIVSDIVLDRPLPEALRDDKDLYAACIAGAAMRRDYLRAVRNAGFRQIRLLADSPWIAASDKDAAGKDAKVGGGGDAKGGACGCSRGAGIAAASITVFAVKPAGRRIPSESGRPTARAADRKRRPRTATRNSRSAGRVPG